MRGTVKNSGCVSKAVYSRLQARRTEDTAKYIIHAQHEPQGGDDAPIEETVGLASETPTEGEPAPTGEADGLTIEMPLTGFTETALGNLERLVAAKATLIKKAIGAETLPIERRSDTLAFPWFSADAAPEAVHVYAVFIERLCKTAKAQKRVTAVERDVENDKYAFRCFLLKLGFIGDEYKAARKVLLARLDGNSAWLKER